MFGHGFGDAHGGPEDGLEEAVQVARRGAVVGLRTHLPATAVTRLHGRDLPGGECVSDCV